MITNMLLRNWNFMRRLRLGLGIYIAVQALQTQDKLAGCISAFFLFQAFTNTGCCGVNRCDTSMDNKLKDNAEELSFEEIK